MFLFIYFIFFYKKAIKHALNHRQPCNKGLDSDCSCGQAHHLSNKWLGTCDPPILENI